MTTLPSTSDVESAFRPAFEEIARRKQACESIRETSHFSRGSEVLQTPFDIPDPEYVLMTMGTAVLAPRPVEPDRPLARIYGAFGSREEAVDHADVVRERDEKCSLVIVQRGKWVLFPRSEAVRDDPEEAQRIVDAKLARRSNDLTQERDEFSKDVTERREREEVRAAPPEDPKEVREREDAEIAVYGKPKRLKAGAEVRGQASAAVCILPDPEGEVMLNVLGCFESSDEADAWIRDVGSRAIHEDDILVVPTCEWFFPNASGDASKAPRYRIGELQRIMDAALKNPQNVRDYKVWKAEQDRIRDEERAAAAIEAAAEAADAEAADAEAAVAGAADAEAAVAEAADAEAAVAEAADAADAIAAASAAVG